ncbi:MAG TPA: phospholipase D-like domain-containing protein [Myxococcota bacterium]|nr:phospholipase D-like domain-containing protein [Myxococcota bacterium]
MSRGKRRRQRLRSPLRRNGLVPRPRAIAELVRTRELRFTDGNRVDLYETGRVGLQAMLAAIERARRRIHLETYILRTDEIGSEFLAALTERASVGVEVRVLYDSLGSFGLDDAALEPLRAAGGQAIAFNPIVRLWPRFAPRRRDHRKILVVDGSVAFMGGLNIGDEYISGLGRKPSGEEWRDAHVRVEGPCVRDLEAVFLESWFRADGPEVAWHSLLERAPAPAGDVRCAVLADGPTYRRRRTRDLLLAALEHAQGAVRLVSPYFAPGRRVLELLAAASARGVSVTLLLAGTRTDHPSLMRATRAVLPGLLACGVRVFEYDAAMMHAKLACFDGDWCAVGTSNLDRQSFEHSYEVNLVIEDADVAKRTIDLFDADIAQAREVTLESLGRRSWLERMRDRFWAVVLRWV